MQYVGAALKNRGQDPSAHYVLDWSVEELSITERYLSALPVGNIFNFNRNSAGFTLIRGLKHCFLCLIT